MNSSPKPFSAPQRASSCKLQGYFLLVMLLALTFFLPLNQVFAQSNQAEIEFWQTVKNSPNPSELQAYLDIYPQGKFAPLARIRLKKIAGKPGTKPVDQVQGNPGEPVRQELIEPSPPVDPSRILPIAPAPPIEPTQGDPIQPSQTVPIAPAPATAPPPAPATAPPPAPAPAPPPVELPVFKPEDTNVTDDICRQRLGPQGVAASDFGGTASICLCRPQFEISSDGSFCVRAEAIVPPPRIVVPPQQKTRRPVTKPRPPRTQRRRPPPVVKRAPRSRNYQKRPPRAQARAIANRYCRSRYGKNLRKVVVKKSKFYCHYALDGNNIIAVKKKKYKDIPR